jgi:hypothetical protein
MAEPYFQGMQPPLMRGIGSLYRKLPTNMRLLAENLFGVDTPITEEDFKPEELEFMREQIADYKTRNIPKPLYRKTSKGWENVPQTYEHTGRTAITNPYTPPGGWWAKNPDGTMTFTGGNADVVDQPWGASLYKSFTDPQYNVATSLGKYVAEDYEGGMRIKDTYDFNKQQRNLPSNPIEALKRILFSPELAGEYLANALGTSPRNVDINLPDV